MPSTAPRPGARAGEHQVVVVGAGFAGIAMGIKLRDAGIDDFVICEQADDLGGTWRENTYPGCACDVPSPLYSYSFAPNPDWTRLFAPQPEIWDYLRRCVERYDLGSHLRLGTEVISAAYDADSARWSVRTGTGAVLVARVLVTGVGALHQPRWPDLPGLDTFAGTTFHSAEWDHGHDLTGERVAVVGTGASAVQFVPEIAPVTRHLTVYQRSAPWVTPKPDKQISPRRRRSFAEEPWRQRRLRRLVFWALEARGVGFALDPRLMKGIEVQARRHLEQQVRDPALRAQLTPDYPAGCKRVLLSDDYYPTLARDDVELVTDPVRAVTATGIVTADGVERPTDTIVLGTGFDVSANLTRIRIVGPDGTALADRWGREGIGAHHGITVAGFPNLFLLVGPNTGLAHSSMVFMIEQQVGYVVQALRLLSARGADSVAVRERVQRRSVGRVQRRLSGRVWSGCQSWYLDASGRNFTLWPSFTWRYWLATRRLRARDFVLRRAARVPAAPLTQR